MSKTYKTRPAWVRAADKPSFLAAEHDHRDPDHACDLPSLRAWTDSGTTCTWEPTSTYWHTPRNRCGCPHCSGTLERKAGARRTRAQGRQLARGQWAGEY